MRKDFEWLNEYSRKFLSGGYLTNQEPEERLRQITDKAEERLGMKGFSNKMFNYLARGYISLASPVWTNYGNERGLPVSCFSVTVGDSVPEILYAASEVGQMSKLGGGTGGYLGNIRHRGAPIQGNPEDPTAGSVHFVELFQAVTDTISQGATRRGRFSPYMPIDHGDIKEFLRIGYEESLIQNVTHAVTVKDEWLESMIAGDAEKREIWAKVLQARRDNGYPYIMFEDNANRTKAQVYQDKDMHITHSNLCSEILLPTNEEESFVCVLSSLNLQYYDEWKDTDLVETMIFFLDTVVTETIEKLEAWRDSPNKEEQVAFSFMERAYNFVVRHRALGLGVTGWHSYLQFNMLPFESEGAMEATESIFSSIRDKSLYASQILATAFGEPELLKGYGQRNTALNAIAPTTSSAFILGQVSQSIEPFLSNYYVKDLAKIKAPIKNPHLQEVLKEKGKDTLEVWKSISEHDGSVQHLDFLSVLEKDVFKTFREIEQMALVQQAAIRQVFLDQTQSLNIAVDSTWSPKDINKLVLEAWRLGIPTLYYQRNNSAAQEFARAKKLSCESCEA